MKNAAKKISGGRTFYEFYEHFEKVDASLSGSSSAIGAIAKKEWVEGMLASWEILSKSYEFKAKAGSKDIEDITKELLNLKSSLDDKVVY